MNFKLAISDMVSVPVIFEQMDGGKKKKFNFKLLMERMTEEDWLASVKDENGIVSNVKIKDQLISITKGWEDQTFVLNEAGAPAEFCEEALAVMFGVPGILNICLNSYVKESAAKAKN